ncbi:cytochrome c [Temperatibacter marinus]|uniref:Cytochrome c n=1 Tax=Temperatibacter marinus TaxID=1456591 RepID=A0AA52HB39_9PROT|nr:cytochrome c [Temperatibacter marinus]WND03248.1 cytochrome c [Temperatibacter marinus]
MKKLLLVSAAAATLITSSAMPQEKAHPTVKYRHHTMETIKDSLIQMKGILNGKGQSADFGIHARVMAVNAEGFYAASRVKIAGGDTKPAAWENWDDFAARMEAYIADTKALAALPEDADQKARAVAFGKAVKNCKACHDKYRAE